MARITIEDCLKTGVYDKFDLVLIASQRTKQINAGSSTEVDKDVKNTLRSLIEIEENKIYVEDVRDAVIHSYQKYGKSNESQNEEEEEYNRNSIVEPIPHDSDSSDDIYEEFLEDDYSVENDDSEDTDDDLEDLDLDDK